MSPFKGTPFKRIIVELILEAIPVPLKSIIGGEPSILLTITPGIPLRDSSNVKAPFSLISFSVITLTFLEVLCADVSNDSVLTIVCSRVNTGFSSAKIIFPPSSKRVANRKFFFIFTSSD